MRSSTAKPPAALCAAMARETGAILTNWGRAPTTLTQRMECSGIERGDGIHHVLQLGFAQLRVDGQRDGLRGGGFGVRAVARLVAEIREAGLQVQRHRVVDLRADALLAQVGLELVALGDADDVLVV